MSSGESGLRASSGAGADSLGGLRLLSGSGVIGGPFSRVRGTAPGRAPRRGGGGGCRLLGGAPAALRVMGHRGDLFSGAWDRPGACAAERRGRRGATVCTGAVRDVALVEVFAASARRGTPADVRRRVLSRAT